MYIINSMTWWLIILMMVMGVITEGGATQILPQTSDELSQKADLIFVGTCLTREVKAGPPTHTEYTFKIETPVKGKLHAGETLTLRQWGGLPGAFVKGPRLIGMPSYEPGQMYMLFLGATSQAGFRTPVGLGQGVFRVQKAADGTTVVLNELGNRFLFPAEPAAKSGKAVQHPSHPPGPLPLNDFIQTIRKTEAQP